jgi:asparagine synthase (glutamine-hydrolysing)
VNFDGAPVDRALLSSMTASLDFRGPDARKVWIGGPGASVGFGHTLLRTTFEAEHEQQPFTFSREAGENQTWIVADCRVDARAELVSKLQAKGRDASLERPDVELILHAWHAWGEQCVEHLLGDFAFAIWDTPNRRLFCARDHMGVKPFYYAHKGSTVIFSNTLDCVRIHPEVSDELNDLAVADFLLFGRNQEKTTTIFCSIKRLAPAEALCVSRSSFFARPFWTLPIEAPLYYRRDRDYIDRFNHLVREAVSDRLRVPRVGIFMSGGLDSPGLAATAVNLLAPPGSVRAFTFTFDRLVPDSERRYAEIAAQYLNIPIRFFALDEPLRGLKMVLRRPEPIASQSNTKPLLECFTAMAEHSRVAFYGEGPDNALEYEWRPHLAWLIREKRWLRLFADVGKHVVQHRRVPLLSTVPRMLVSRTNSRLRNSAFPGWLAPAFVDRLDLRRRWSTFRAGLAHAHPVRPVGYSSMLIPLWQGVFEELEPSYTTATLEVRHPYVDLRVLRFLLRVPALPWCRRKHLVREALRGVLPEELTSRPKTPLRKDPAYELATVQGMQRATPGAAMARYVDHSQLPAALPTSPEEFRALSRATALGNWLPVRNSILKIKGALTS